MMNWKAVARWLIAALYLAAGYFHLASPQPFLSIMPARVPWPDTVVLWTGVAEIAGAAVFLAAPAGGFVTGQTIVVDGGSTIKGI